MDPDEAHVYLHRHAHDTEFIAAESSLPKTVENRQRIVRALGQRGGLTDTEIEKVCDLLPNSERPRRYELVEKLFMVRDSGERRPSMLTGMPTIVWKLNDLGWLYYRWLTRGSRRFRLIRGG